MDTVLEIDNNFDFTKLSLGQPQPFQGGSFFTKITYNGHDLQIQFPKCKTKQGINQTERKYFADLLYETVDSSELTAWLETLESTCQKLIFNKRDMWFHSQIELNDIETAFTNSARLYKSGKQFLIRCQISKLHNNKQGVIIYDEDEKMLNIQDVTCDKDIIPLLRIEGIKFSARSFQIEYNLTQIMVLREYEEVSHCMIKHNKPAITTAEVATSASQINLENTTVFSPLMTQNTESVKMILPTENLLAEPKIKEIITLEIKNNSLQENEIKPVSESINQNTLVNTDTNINVNINANTNANTNANINANTNDNDKETLLGIIENSSEKQSNDLEPVEITFNEIQEEMKLRKPNEVYYEIYRAAREKAKLAKLAAIEAYLEAKNIKTKYMLEDLDESFDDESEYLEELSQ